MKNDVVIVGGGSGGIAVAASLLKRNVDVKITIIDPADTHYYQPGFTMIGAGVFKPAQVERSMTSVIPKGVVLIKAAVVGFEPEKNAVILDDGDVVNYDRLVVVPGLKLDWGKIEGLEEALGRNGVTSNYRHDLAPYTWELVQNLKSGNAIFTQPPMPIKCAGAPQKAMYLSADYWMKHNHLKDINVQFNNAGGVLFGVSEYVPALMEYIERYQIQLNFMWNLTKIDGDKKVATFDKTDADGNVEEVISEFDMIHVCPPQTAPDFIKNSALADAGGWVDVDQRTLRHTKYDNIWGLGDVTNTPNAKTAAAVRTQAPIVAHNIIEDMEASKGVATYNGYGSCPLTVERGKIVLAEFGYGGKILPTLPVAVLNGEKPTRLAWFLKVSILPNLYWNYMLKGNEIMAKPVVEE